MDCDYGAVSHTGFLFLFLLLFSVALVSMKPSLAQEGNGSATEMTPLAAPGRGSVLVLNETRRRLGSFQICALCTCCGGPRGLCLPSPCCYAINCNIPNRPFGYCSFTPKTCNCFGCHL